VTPERACTGVVCPDLPNEALPVFSLPFGTDIVLELNAFCLTLPPNCSESMLLFGCTDFSVRCCHLGLSFGSIQKRDGYQRVLRLARLMAACAMPQKLNTTNHHKIQQEHILRREQLAKFMWERTNARLQIAQ
jgi:hypothetical protein